MSKPKLPMGNMKVSKAKQRWEDVRKAAQSGDPAAMMDAVSRFQGIADTMLLYFANRNRLREERDTLKTEVDKLQHVILKVIELDTEASSVEAASDNMSEAASIARKAVNGEADEA